MRHIAKAVAILGVLALVVATVPAVSAQDGGGQGGPVMTSQRGQGGQQGQRGQRGQQGQGTARGQGLSDQQRQSIRADQRQAQRLQGCRGMAAGIQGQARKIAQAGRGKGQSQGRGQGQAQGVGQGQGQAQGGGRGQGQAQGSGQGRGQAQGSGQGRGQAQGSGRGQGQAQGAGQGRGQAQGSGQGQGQAQGASLGQGFNLEQIRGMGTQITEQAQRMLGEHDQLMQGLSGAQRSLLSDQTQVLNRTRGRIQDCVNFLNQAVGATNPDPQGVAERADDLDQAMETWRKQYQRLGEDMGVRSGTEGS